MLKKAPPAKFFASVARVLTEQPIFSSCESLEDEPFEPRNIYWLSFGWSGPTSDGIIVSISDSLSQSGIMSLSVLERKQSTTS